MLRFWCVTSLQVKPAVWVLVFVVYGLVLASLGEQNSFLKIADHNAVKGPRYKIFLWFLPNQLDDNFIIPIWYEIQKAI